MSPSTVPWGTPEVNAIFSDVVFSKVLSVFCLQEKMLSSLLFGQIYHKLLAWRLVFCVALYQTLLRSPLLLNLFEYFYHCFVLVGEQVILFVIHMTYSI
jgi:hypothetical protein